MSHTAALTPSLINEQLALLQAERRYYSSRLLVIAGDPARREEMNGYLNLIENINVACVRLARDGRSARPSSRPAKLAA
jgi:hypothetical protein